MATTKFYLDLRGKAKDGKGSINITITHNRAVAMIPTGIRVSPNEWGGQNVIKVLGSDVLNARLAERKLEVDRALALLSLSEGFEDLTATQIKTCIIKRQSSPRSHLVYDLFQEYISREMAQGTRDIYLATWNKVKAFGGERINIEEIDLKWLYDFEKYLSKQQGVNGRAIFLRSLRAVVNYAIHSGVIQSYPFSNFKIKQEPTRKRSVSIDQFRKFLSYPTTESNQRYRDYFLLMFYLIGINSKDLLLASPSAVSNGRFEYIRGKTHKKYSVRIEPEAEELLRKYRGEHYLLEAMDSCKDYRNFVHEMNDALKTIGDISWEMIPDPDDLFAKPTLTRIITPVIPNISTYWSRHCWATFAYEAGISIDIISQALGHSMGNRTTLIYVKEDKEKVAKANRQVIDYLWEKTSSSE